MINYIENVQKSGCYLYKHVMRKMALYLITFSVFILSVCTDVSITDKNSISPLG